MAGKTTTIATAVVKLATDTASYSAGVEKVRKENKGFLASLQADFGRGSPLAKVLKGLQGGGILLGLGLAAKEFEALTGKAAELADGLRKGEKPAGELVGDFARSIPVIGNVIKGFDNIGEAISGARVEIDKINAAIKITDITTAAIKYRADAVREMAEKYRGITEPDKEKSSLIPLQGSTKAFQELQFGYAKREQEIQKIFSEASNPDKNEKLKKMRGEYFDAFNAFSKERAPQQSDYMRSYRAYRRDPHHYNDLVETQIREPDVGAFNAANQQYINRQKALDGLRSQLNEVFNDAAAERDKALKELFGSSDKFKIGDFFFPQGGSAGPQFGQVFGEMVREGFNSAQASAELYKGKLSNTVLDWFGLGGGGDFAIDKEIAEKVKSLHDSLKSPFENLQDRQGELDELMRNKKISPKDYQLGTGRALQDFISQNNSAPQYAPAVEARTARVAFGEPRATVESAIKQAQAKNEENHKEVMELARQWFSYMQGHTVQPVGISNP